MARQEHKPLSRLRAALLAAVAAVLALIAGLSVAAGTPALAATEARGNCTPYLSVTPGGVISLGSPEPVEVYDVTWAGSSSGWSPPGSLRITASVYENGISIGSVTGTEDGTSVSTPVGGPVRAPAADAVFSVAVTAYGPAGKVTCATERLAAGDGLVIADDEPSDSANGGSKPAGGSGAAIDTRTGLTGWGLTGASATPALDPKQSWAPYLTLTP
jgi:hypothetical protein